MKGSKPKIALTLQKRIAALPHIEKNGLKIVENFGIFIDTHRDQPHVGTFHDDVHRGHCIPMKVDYLIEDDVLRNPEDGRLIDRHEKHMFITEEQWGGFLMDKLITTGVDPRNGEGSLPTSHFRDARNGVYVLKSFRQMVTEVEKRA